MIRLSNVYHLKYLSTLATDIYSRLIRANNYALVNCEIKLSQLYYASFFDLSNEIIYDWLSYEKECWTAERPSLQLYSKLLVLSQLNVNLPEDIFFDVLRAMNYYGNYKQVITLAKKNMTNIDDYFSLVKYIGKAYKSLGLYDRAMRYYRIAIAKAFELKDISRVAFFYYLLEKFVTITLKRKECTASIMKKHIKSCAN